VLETVIVSEDSFRLYYAAFTNDVNLIKSLHIAHELNHYDYDGRTALGIAASEGHLEAVQYLVSHGANIHHKDARGNDALADAKREGRVNVVEYLEKIMLSRSQ
jgi:glutaminase